MYAITYINYNLNIVLCHRKKRRFRATYKIYASILSPIILLLPPHPSPGRHAGQFLLGHAETAPSRTIPGMALQLAKRMPDFPML